MNQLFALSDRKKGSLVALLATIFFSNVYIFSKAALNEVSLPKFMFYWFVIAFTLSIFISLQRQDFKALRKLGLKEYRGFLLMGAIEMATTFSFYTSLKMIHDPAVASFLGNMFVVFLVVLGVLFLKERFTRLESIGVIITIIGAFAVGYKGGHTLSDFFIEGTGVVLINTFLAAVSSIVAKRLVSKHSPTLVNLNRTFFLTIFGIVYFLISRENFYLPPKALTNIVLGVLMGPILGIGLIYTSYKYIEVSRSSVLQSLKGVFVLIGTYLYFSTFPSAIQLIGGIGSVIGVLIMTLSKAKLLFWNRSKTDFSASRLLDKLEEQSSKTKALKPKDDDRD